MQKHFTTLFVVFFPLNYLITITVKYENDSITVKYENAFYIYILHSIFFYVILFYLIPFSFIFFIFYFIFYILHFILFNFLFFFYFFYFLNFFSLHFFHISRMTCYHWYCISKHTPCTFYAIGVFS